MQIAIGRGRDLYLPGKPVQEIHHVLSTRLVALVGSDIPDVRPTFEVETGDKVLAGQTLFVDSRRPELAFAAPVSGRVSEVRRGPRRTLDIITIEADQTNEQASRFEVPKSSDGDGVRRLLLEAGQWPAFRSRPFERIPDPAAEPAAIFVTAMDTEPLSADPATILRDEAGPFGVGLEAIGSLPAGPLFVCVASGAPVPGDIDRAQFVEFSGPHPAGLPGTHIHKLMPVSRTRQVWHIGYQDVIAIGRLFMTGRIWSERVVALAGPAVREPCLVRTHLGADLNELAKHRCVDGEVSIVSGSVLSGRPARFLGRYHLQVGALPQNQDWFARGFLARLLRAFGDGRTGAIIPVAAHEDVMAFDIPPVPLLRALSVGDAEAAEQLGCLELAESDVALLSHVCPSGVDYAPLLRAVLGEIE